MKTAKPRELPNPVDATDWPCTVCGKPCYRCNPNWTTVITQSGGHAPIHIKCIPLLMEPPK